ncbi:PREDICTED: interleukin-33 [Chrysochloris asiatica]|uniref:Interleukin-33 n=1 Tax=Chrysochloris asiatica TaxID=185453 RepID=A0A9B0TNA7_CHRAS|nr:PREDICTED: interleukin-33 [Chrysochloris asiatica]
MTLRSGHTIKKACYFKNETTKRTSSETGNKHKKQHLVICNCRSPPAQRLPPQKIVLETHREEKRSTDRVTGPRPVLIQHASLSTFDDQLITFADEGGVYTIYVEDLRKKQKKNKVVLLCYDSKIPAGESGYEAGAVEYMVNLSLSANRNFCLHADSKQLSVDVREFPELQKPEQTFFLLRRPSAIHYSFECKSKPGTYLGVSGNHLELIPTSLAEAPTQLPGHPGRVEQFTSREMNPSHLESDSTGQESALAGLYFDYASP